MFPLKRRRKFLRVSDLNIIVDVLVEDDIKSKQLIDISASGCKINNTSEIDINNDKIKVMFKLNNVDFNIKVKYLRDDCFEFMFDNEVERGVLNKVLLKEYFKDTPELLL